MSEVFDGLIDDAVRGRIFKSAPITTQTFTATNSFRWKNQSVTSEGGKITTELPNLLQQAWQGSDGTIEWRELPIEP